MKNNSLQGPIQAFGRTFVAQESVNGCTGCAFEQGRGRTAGCGPAACMSDVRDDGVDVIFVEAPADVAPE